ncbi:MAG: elongation factor P [Candidatus Alcyoniella australis]|nr:elongation factor P [Candidatus Alcyoniella australis]
MKMTATRIRAGNVIDYKGEPYRILQMTHITPGKGNAVVQVKMRNLISGVQTEERFRSTDTVERAMLETKELQYLYKQGDRYVLMDTSTYEMTELDEEAMGDAVLFIKPDAMIQAQLYAERIIGIDPPAKVELEVIETDPPLKGATAANSPKPAKLETGLVVTVPSFIAVGTMIRVDTEKREYVERV